MEKEVFEKFKAQEKALELQAKEYERRLTDLNGEAGRLREMQARYTPRETFDNTIVRLNEKIDIINTWKVSQEGKSKGTGTVGMTVAIILTMLISIISIILQFKNS